MYDARFGGEHMLTDFEYHRPANERQVSELIQRLGGDFRLLAGGTDLVVQMRNGTIKPRHVVDLASIAGLRWLGIAPEGWLNIGATATVSDLVTHPDVLSHYDALVEGGRAVGSLQIQNRATLVGNICNASPAADTVPALLVFDAQVRVGGADGHRWVPLRSFLRGPGKTALGGREWVERIRLPPVGPTGSCYLKLGRTRGVDLAVVGVACCVSATDASVSFASVAPTALWLNITEFQDLRVEELEEDTLQAIRSLLRPIDDVRGSAAYRMEMALVLARRAWQLARHRFVTASEAS